MTTNEGTLRAFVLPLLSEVTVDSINEGWKAEATGRGGPFEFVLVPDFKAQRPHSSTLLGAWQFQRTTLLVFKRAKQPVTETVVASDSKRNTRLELPPKPDAVTSLPRAPQSHLVNTFVSLQMNPIDSFMPRDDPALLSGSIAAETTTIVSACVNRQA